MIRETLTDGVGSALAKVIEISIPTYQEGKQ